MRRLRGVTKRGRLKPAASHNRVTDMTQKAVVFSFVLLAACTTGENGSTDKLDNASEPGLNGRVAYEAACSSCHDAGTDGAPRTGYPEDWVGRSSLWQSVLTEHAKAGYLQMPAKGGDPVIDDERVAAATEYMLLKSHPDRLPDQ